MGNTDNTTQLREELNSKLNGFFCRYGKEGSTAWFIITKVATDLVPDKHDKAVKLAENGFLQQLATDGKEHIVYLAADLVKHEIKLGAEEFHNQIEVIDRFIFMFNDFFINGHLKREPNKTVPVESESDLGLIQMLVDMTKEDLTQEEIIESLKVELPIFEDSLVVNKAASRGNFLGVGSNS